MIPRYDCPEISSLWADEYKFKQFLKVEISLLEVLEENKIIPAGTATEVSNKAVINPKRIEEIEQTTQHDIIAFCTSITENMTANAGKYFHYGVTSSDIIDTAMTLQIKASLEIICHEFDLLLKSLWDKCLATQNILAIGRSHGMYAEPLSFGQKLLSHYCELSRRSNELKNFLANDLTGQLSGAVGSYTILTPEIEEQALAKLGLKAEPVSTQVIPRDRIAKLISINALIAAALERLAIEIRHLHHSDIAEVYEGFAPGQKGSSTMPHKKNPISSENISGMARLLRSHLEVAHQNILLWHERDISHSSAERLFLPDNLGLLQYSLKRMKRTIDRLVVQEDNIEAKVKENFTYLSSYYLHWMIAHYPETREVFYEIIQKASFNSNNLENFVLNITKFSAEKGLNVSNLPQMNFDKIKGHYLEQSGKIFDRVKKEYNVI